MTSVGPNPLRNHGSDSVRGWDEFANDTFRDLLEETKVAPQVSIPVEPIPHWVGVAYHKRS